MNRIPGITDLILTDIELHVMREAFSIAKARFETAGVKYLLKLTDEMILKIDGLNELAKQNEITNK